MTTCRSSLALLLLLLASNLLAAPAPLPRREKAAPCPSAFLASGDWVLEWGAPAVPYHASIMPDGAASFSHDGRTYPAIWIRHQGGVLIREWSSPESMASSPGSPSYEYLLRWHGDRWQSSSRHAVLRPTRSGE